MASVIYDAFKQKVMDAEADLDSGTFYVALLSNAYSPNAKTHAVWSDISGSEISGTGYVAGGTLLAGMTVTLNTSTDKAVLSANNVTWPNSTITARYCAIYKYTAPQWLVCAFDFGADKASNNGDFTIQWNASGILDLT
jgi:hypothetical protein